MSHLHLPDGILPLWLLALGFVLSGLILLVVWRLAKKELYPRQASLVGFFAALMLLGMSLEIVPIAYHVNLTVLTGIIIGPLYGLIAALIVNLLLALLGHGGLTVLGLNFLITGSEVITAYFLFYFLRKYWKNIFAASMITTVLALAISTTLSFGVIAAGGNDIDQVLEHEHTHTVTRASVPNLDLFRLATLMYGLGTIGWLLEGSIVGLVLTYINKIKPELLTHDS